MLTGNPVRGDLFKAIDTATMLPNPVRDDLSAGWQAKRNGAQGQVTPDGVWEPLGVLGSINRSPLAGFTETAHRG